MLVLCHRIDTQGGILQLNKPVSILPDMVVCVERLGMVVEGSIELIDIELDEVAATDFEALDRTAELVAAAVFPEVDSEIV